MNFCAYLAKHGVDFRKQMPGVTDPPFIRQLKLEKWAI